MIKSEYSKVKLEEKKDLLGHRNPTIFNKVQRLSKAYLYENIESKRVE